MRISRKTKESGRWVPNRGRPRGGQNPDTATILADVHDAFGRSNAAQGILTPVACGPATPRPKDCPGLGDPNTFK